MSARHRGGAVSRGSNVNGLVTLVLALTLVALLGLMATRSLGMRKAGERPVVVVVVGMSPNEGQVAELVLRAPRRGAQFEVVDTAARVSGSGTSVATLRSTYALVTSDEFASLACSGTPADWVEVPSTVLQSAAGAATAPVRISRGFDVLAGSSLRSFDAGVEEVSTTDMGALLEGARLLGVRSRLAIQGDIASFMGNLLSTRGIDVARGSTSSLARGDVERLLAGALIQPIY